MQTWVVTFLFFAAVMAAMAIGLMQGRRLKGSCGGQGGDCPCDEAAQRDCELKRRREAA